VAELHLLLLERGAVVLAGAEYDLAQVDVLPPQLDPAARDPRDVEEVIHDACQVLRLAVENLYRALRTRERYCEGGPDLRVVFDDQDGVAFRAEPLDAPQVVPILRLLDLFPDAVETPPVGADGAVVRRRYGTHHLDRRSARALQQRRRRHLATRVGQQRREVAQPLRVLQEDATTREPDRPEISGAAELSVARVVRRRGRPVEERLDRVQHGRGVAAPRDVGVAVERHQRSAGQCSSEIPAALECTVRSPRRCITIAGTETAPTASETSMR
jgi:hypothetical protein